MGLNGADHALLTRGLLFHPQLRLWVVRAAVSVELPAVPRVDSVLAVAEAYKAYRVYTGLRR